MNPQPHINYEASGQEGRGGIHSRETATNKETFSPNSSTPHCPFPNHIPSGKQNRTKKSPLISSWLIQVFAKCIQEGKHSTRTQMFIQRGFFKPFSSKYKWMSHPQPDRCFIPIFWRGFVPPLTAPIHCRRMGMDGSIHPSPLLRKNQGIDRFAGKKPPNSPKREDENTLQYCRGFSSLPEESVEARGSPWLRGKLGDLKKSIFGKAGEAKHAGN